jgi:hypothetical protein
MSDKERDNKAEDKQEVKIEDLPVDEAKADQVKGGPHTQTQSGI